MRKEELNKRIEDTLNSVNNVKRAKAGSFLYERTLNKLQHESNHRYSFTGYKKLAWSLGIAIVTLTGVNYFTLFNYTKVTNDTSSISKQQILQNFGNEYSITTNNYNY